jgi:hypothetical protein
VRAAKLYALNLRLLAEQRAAVVQFDGGLGAEALLQRFLEDGEGLALEAERLGIVGKNDLGLRRGHARRTERQQRPDSEDRAGFREIFHGLDLPTELSALTASFLPNYAASRRTAPIGLPPVST